MCFLNRALLHREPSLSYAIDGGHRRPKRKEMRLIYVYIHFNVIDGRDVLRVQMLEVPTLGVGTVLRLEKEAWSMVK